MITISEKVNCCGCAACYSVCPTQSISMDIDTEGFCYPTVDLETCINCGRCEQVCPILHPTEEHPFEQSAYLFQNSDETVRLESTSGGAFSAIAELVIDNNGVVFGATFDQGLTVRHIFTESREDLKWFRNSKYVQSEIGETFRQTKQFLDIGRQVCFSGTPCQIEGLKHFLKKDYPNLLTIDIVCRAVPSPLVFQKYLSYQRNKLGIKVSKVVFRDKHPYGYQRSVMAFYTDAQENPVYFSGIESDPYLRAFFSSICNRPSCYACKFKKRYRISDLTLWDCFEIDSWEHRMDDNKGASRILAHSAKGNNIIEQIKGKHSRVYSVDPDQITSGAKELTNSVTVSPKRDEFFSDMQTFTENELFNKYFPLTRKVKIEKLARDFSYKLGIYRLMRKTYKTLFPNQTKRDLSRSK